MNRRKIARSLARFSGTLQNLSHRIYESPKRKRNMLWRKEHGDEDLRLKYDLDENSLVIDLGGYKGQWASDIFAMYRCRIHIFEAVPKFAARIAERFRKNARITVHANGLAGKTERMKIKVAADGSSVFSTKEFKADEGDEEISLIRAADFFEQNALKKVDLMKINIEGGEYDLLEHLLDTGLIRQIVDVQIQFHDFVPNAEERMQAIQKRLEQTHRTTFQYPFVWENWHLKDA